METHHYLLESEPALLRTDWVPPGTQWEDLGQLGAEHVRRLAERDELAAAVGAVRQRFDAEDEARHEALEGAYREGSQAEAPEVTPPEERQAELRAATEHLQAANAALADFLESARTQIRESGDEWLERVDEQESEAVRKREEARRLLSEAETAVGEAQRLRMWVQRNARGRHVCFGQLGVPQPPQTHISPDTAAGVIASA